MEKIYALFTLASLLLLLTNCQKEQFGADQTAAAAQLTAQQRLDNLNPPSVLFQFSVLDLETDEESGWIIDRSGNIRTYHMVLPSGQTPQAENEIWRETEVNSLYDRTSEILGAVEIEALLARLQQSYSLNSAALTETTTNHNEKLQVSYYAFSPEYGSSNGDRSSYDGECGAGYTDPHQNADDTAEPLVNRRIIHLSGYLNRYENSNNGVDLYQWLKQEQEER